MSFKNLKLISLVLASFYVLPVHAIDSKYSQKLDRSGCTELTDGNGCDINKTKEENGISSGKNGSKETREIKEFIKYSVVNQKVDDAYNALEGYGWESTQPSTWVKGKYTLMLDIQNDTVVNTILK